MEDPRFEDIYFSVPGLSEDVKEEEIYLSWGDLVGKPEPEVVFFSWEDILGHNGEEYSKQDPHLPLSTTFKSKTAYDSSASSDAGDSRWDDTASTLSYGISNTAGSRSIHTTDPAPSTCDSDSWPCSVAYEEVIDQTAASPLLKDVSEPDASCGVYRDFEKSNIATIETLPSNCRFEDRNISAEVNDETKTALSIATNDANDNNINALEDMGKSRSGSQAHAKKAAVDQAMEEFWVIFNQGWTLNLTRQAENDSHGSDTPPESFPSGSSTTNESKNTEKTQQALPRKRPRDDDSSDQGDGRGSRPPAKRSQRPVDLEAQIKLACPFYKHDPSKYSIYSHRTCALGHWTSIARVKEHLYRCHLMPIHCKRCRATFKSQQQLDAHIMVASKDICPLHHESALEGITAEMEKRLRSRKRKDSKEKPSEESRWGDVYGILFPGEGVPSPCKSHLRAASVPTQLILSQITSQILEVTAEPPVSPSSQQLVDCEEYMRRELPLMVRTEIEKAVHQKNADTLAGTVVDIIRDCQDQLFRRYREGLDVGIEGGEVDMLLPPSIDEDDLEPSQTKLSADSRDDLHARPPEFDFLDAAFDHPPLLQTTDNLFTLYDKQIAGLPASGTLILSDSGYASDILCFCNGPCSCAATTMSSSSYYCPALDNAEVEEDFHWSLGSKYIGSAPTG